MPKHDAIPTDDVLAWLKENHPKLAAVAEVDRSWVWLVADLRADEATRKSIKDFGFVFAKRGGHHLPSGRLGTWGHSCDTPTPFKRFGGGKKKKSSTTPKPEPRERVDSLAVSIPAADDPTFNELIEFAYANDN